MTGARVKALVAAALMAVSFGGAQAWKPRTHLADSRPAVALEQLFPKRFGEWALVPGPAMLVSPDTEALLNKLYNDTLSRTYANAAGQRIMLSVAYGGDQSDGTSAHLPEVCYPAQGFQVLSRHNAVFRLAGEAVPVRQLLTRQGPRSEPVSYWIVVGERIALSGTDQKLAQLSYSVRGVIPDGMLVRVSSIDEDAAAAFRLHEKFASDLVASLEPTLAPRVVGHAGR